MPKVISQQRFCEKNSQWKGDKVGYIALHNWVRRRKPKPEFCEICNKRKPYDLSNISGKYKRDINDYKCVNCGEEIVEHEGDWCENCDNPLGDKYA
jgi:hypothetical protein